jgi:hypothetical protein
MNSKIRGTKGEYTKEYIYRIPETESRFYWEVPKFIGNIWDRKIDFIPYSVDLLITGRPLDLVETGGPLSLKLLISSKLKAILQAYRRSGFQCFPFNVLKDNIVYPDYWTLHFFEFDQEFIDFQETMFLYEKQKEDYATSYLTQKNKIRFNSEEDFYEHKKITSKKGEGTFIVNLKLKDSLDEDFFALKDVEGGIGYFVSETLKNEIENAGCTGIEFQPSELSYNEWVVKGGPRDQVYRRPSQ